VPEDHKLFVFNGRCRFVQVDTARFGARTQDFFDADWTTLDLTGGYPRSAVPPPRPGRLHEMIDLAERLGAGTDFVRVDLFTLPERVLVGELTSSPAGGDSPFHPPGVEPALRSPLGGAAPVPLSRVRSLHRAARLPVGSGARW
jgi:hypothetical protein